MATFGNSGTGNTSSSGLDNGYVFLSRYNLMEPALVSKLSARMGDESGVGSQEIRGLIYEVASDGLPGALVGVTPYITLTSDVTLGWYDLTFTTPLELESGYYWLGIWVGPTTDVSYICSHMNGNGYTYVETYSSSADPSDPCSKSMGGCLAYDYCIYATYEKMVPSQTVAFDTDHVDVSWS
jgi:hypothetical protein